MKNFENFMHTENVQLKSLVIEETPGSLLVMAKKKIFVPEKKFVLMDHMNEQETQFFLKETQHKGGLIV